MKVRRPECDEQPSNPKLANKTVNHVTMLVGGMPTPRIERTTGPDGADVLLRATSARLRLGCIGMRRPPRFLAMASETARQSATRPRASRTIDQSSRAISQ